MGTILPIQLDLHGLCTTISRRLARTPDDPQIKPLLSRDPERDPSSAEPVVCVRAGGLLVVCGEGPTDSVRITGSAMSDGIALFEMPRLLCLITSAVRCVVRKVDWRSISAPASQRVKARTGPE